MSETQDLSKSVYGSVENTGTKSCCVSPSQSPSNKEVVCDGDVCPIRFKDPPVEEKGDKESSAKVENENEGGDKVEESEGGKKEEKDESKKQDVQLTGLDQLFSSLLGSVLQGGPGGPGLSGLGGPGVKGKRRSHPKDDDDGPDKESVSSRSGDDDDDYEDDCDPDCRNDLKWRSLDKLLDSHANLTRVLADLWESEKSD
jgi:hypothetical protein